MEEDKNTNNCKVCMLHGINISICILFGIWFINDSISKYESKDIMFFTKFILISMTILMIILTVYDFKGTRVARENINSWKNYRYVHHILIVTLFISLYLSGYHSFTGYFVGFLTIPTLFFWTDLWADVVVARNAPKVAHS